VHSWQKDSKDSKDSKIQKNQRFKKICGFQCFRALVAIKFVSRSLSGSWHKDLRIQRFKNSKIQRLAPLSSLRSVQRFKRFKRFKNSKIQKFKNQRLAPLSSLRSVQRFKRFKNSKISSAELPSVGSKIQKKSVDFSVSVLWWQLNSCPDRYRDRGIRIQGFKDSKDSKIQKFKD